MQPIRPPQKDGNEIIWELNPVPKELLSQLANLTEGKEITRKLLVTLLH